MSENPQLIQTCASVSWHFLSVTCCSLILREGEKRMEMFGGFWNDCLSPGSPLYITSGFCDALRKAMRMKEYFLRIRKGIFVFPSAWSTLHICRWIVCWVPISLLSGGHFPSGIRECCIFLCFFNCSNIFDDENRVVREFVLWSMVWSAVCARFHLVTCTRVRFVQCSCLIWFSTLLDSAVLPASTQQSFLVLMYSCKVLLEALVSTQRDTDEQMDHPSSCFQNYSHIFHCAFHNSVICDPFILIWLFYFFWLQSLHA